ncbi:tRNA 2-thiouridine(34) synthase MnmA [Candidatus Pacearchaeota archaeon CG10_big_fil_rev_8_21_14_0_10_34_76]|nr:MAG: tRNA 2-thiouridine(34) synthase MnmA [Candidatus Pacearchaeota archaeon CG10_big_fil_rev_8_21_14_0_10_34_76]
MKKGKTVLLGMSGGVDSSVAALLLKEQGYNVIGAFMINFSETKNKLTGECSWVEDKKDAQKIASKLEIPFIILNFEEQYKSKVIDPMFISYSKGFTPNPDTSCNALIKFPLLWKEAKKIGADYIATGHYARVMRKSSGFSLLAGKDPKKDQSYFLYELNQEDLSHTLFPIGGLTKEDVRKIAKKNGFHNWDKKGTRGICFVGNINMKLFLQQRIKQDHGKIVDMENKIIGTHKGVMFYTLGERIRSTIGTEIKKGALSQKKWYVAGKNIKLNILIAAPENHPALFKKEFILKKIHWISKKPEFPLRGVRIRIRHLGELIPSEILVKGSKHICALKKSVAGLATGQAAVIYRGKEILGGGEINL